MMAEEPLISIMQASADFHISTRTLRYYEEMGLIKSVRDGDLQTRYFSKVEYEKIRDIMTLRSFELPLKDIKTII